VSKAVYILAHPTARQRAVDAVRNAADGMVVTVAEPTRNLEQNAALWAILSEVSEHVVWHGRKLSPEDWKHIFTASLKRMDVVPNLEGTGFVALGLSTSKMSKREFSDLLELVNAFAAERIEVTA
jgi:hypothetical protein